MFNQPMLRDGALQGKTVIVTGGGTGLGKSMSTYFLQLGANVVITSRKLDVLEKTAAELSASTKGNCFAVACDVRNYEEVENVLKLSIEKFGQVDVLVNNAAGNFISPTERSKSGKPLGAFLQYRRFHESGFAHRAHRQRRACHAG